MQLQFSYYMSRRQTDGGSLLQLFQVSKLGIPVQLLFENSMSVDTCWQLATVCLPLGSYSLAFQGTMGNPLVSDIAIDSIKVTLNNQCLVVLGQTAINKNGTCEIDHLRLLPLFEPLSTREFVAAFEINSCSSSTRAPLTPPHN